MAGNGLWLAHRDIRRKDRFHARGSDWFRASRLESITGNRAIAALLLDGTVAQERIRVFAENAQSRLPWNSVTLLPPVTDAAKIICLGLNYKDHATETKMALPTFPSIFLRTQTTLVGHGSPIVRPKNSTQLDYEGELVAVIGRRARHIRKPDSLDYVAGYSIFNDASIRDFQLRTSQWTIGKNFDRTGGFGPELVTADELPPGATGLRLQTRLNGDVLQNANTTDMVFGVARTIELLSACMTLGPGDLLVMGTPSGVGLSRQPQLWMKPGDTCEVEIEGIGTLTNPIIEDTA